MKVIHKVFLLDDHKIIRDGIRSILTYNSAYKIVGEEGNPIHFLEILDKLDIDILLMDLTFPNTTGFQMLPKIKKLRPEIKVLILSMHNDPESMQRCMSLGAHGYLPKDCDAFELLKALEVVALGKTYLSIELPATSKIKDTENILSSREREVLSLLSNGLSSKQIAGQLSISARTVESHRLNIMKKLNTTNSAETISVATRLHLI